MNHLNKKAAILIAIVFFLSCIQLASAAIYYTPTYANVSANFMVNITISPQIAITNVSQIIIKNQALPPFAVNASSNQTSVSAGLSNFITSGQNLIWYNLTAAGLTNDTVNQSFTIIINSTMAGAPSSFKLLICLYNSTVTNATMATRACDPSDQFFVENLTATIGMNFGFSGYVKNETGGYHNQTNVTIYEFVMGTNGPPTETPLASALTDGNGFFGIYSINGSGSLYKVKLVYNNGTRVTKVGSNLPPFPNSMFYPMPLPPGMENIPMFKKMPVINGSTFYLQAAATINVSAVGNVPFSNMTNNISVKFGYEIIDQAVGFPIESNIRNNVLSKEIYVPTGRSYTVMAVRDPVSFLPYPWCFSESIPQMNTTACPSPPMSMQVTSANLTEGGMVQAVLNLSYSMHYLSGCINVNGNNSVVYVTSVIPKLVPWEGFVPPIDAKISSFDITNSTDGYGGNIVYGDQEKCSGALAFYNMSLMGSGSGIGYLLEFYARNALNNSAPVYGTVDVAMFQNLSMTESSKFMNITLYPLAGLSYNVSTSSNTVNASKMKLFVQNSSGTAITSNMHMELKVKHPVFGTMHYIIEDLSGGTTYMPILANSTWAKVSVFPNNGPPLEKTLNLNLIQNNITIPVSDFTFRRPLPNGSLETINSSKGASSGADKDTASDINMTFYRNAVGCNTPNPPESCVLTRMNANDFNPMLVMMAGKVNLELKMVASGTTLYFINFDLLSAKPPTNSIMNNNASSASAANQQQTWEQGSFVPHVYDYAYVVMPYNDTIEGNLAPSFINESYTSFNMSLPFLRDENWGLVWNNSNSTGTPANLPDDYTDFNVGAYATLLRDGGSVCSTTNATDVCFMNTTDSGIIGGYFALKVPHFSGVGSGIGGLAPAAGTAASSSSSSSSSTGSATDKAVSESRTFAAVAKNSENTYRLSDSETIGVNAVVFTATEDLESVKVVVTKLLSKPSSVSPDPNGEIYRYIEIDAPKLKDKTKEAKIQFEVTQKWFTDNGYKAEDVILVRFADDKWKELTTSKLREDSSKVYYEAISPGFSYFAITAKKTEVKEEETAESVTAPSETPVAPELPPAAPATDEGKTGIVKTLLIAIGILVVLFLAVLGYKKKTFWFFGASPQIRKGRNM